MKTTLLILLSLSVSTSGENCLVPASTTGKMVPFRGDVCSSLPSGTLAIITSYKFECHGRILSWHTYITTTTSDQETNQNHTISFQVWRASSTVSSDGCYGLVGENVFVDITPTEDGLISVVPTPCEVITVAPGDVVGYFSDVNGTRGTVCGGNSTEIKLDESYMEESVWYDTKTDYDPFVDSGPMTCPFPVGPEPDKTLRSLTRAAPMLSIEMENIQITPTPTISATPTSGIRTTDAINILYPSPSHEEGVTPKRPQANPARLGGLIVTVLFLVTLFSTVVVVSILIVRKKKRNQRIYLKDLTTYSQTYDSMEDSMGSSPRVTTAETAVVPGVDYTVVDPLFSSSNLYGSMTMNHLVTSTSVTIEIKRKPKKKP